MATTVGDPKLKAEQQNVIVVSSDGPEKAINIDELKEIDEEVQYAIANHQSYLNPLSKESWLLYGMLFIPVRAVFQVVQEPILILDVKSCSARSFS